ncbi:hypothetical protein P5673_030349, partial [Acropora cervicornis]
LTKDSLWCLSQAGHGIGVTSKETFRDTFLAVRGRINELLSGPGSSMGYCSVWHTLEMEGLRVPRVIVQDLLKEMDPEGSEFRRKQRLKRRTYQNPGPNFSWHIDGFPFHGTIDGFSRRILWLKVCRSNNCPRKIASFYATTVSELGGCPVQLITDLGTENGLSAALQSFFRENSQAHRYVASPRNQRIEGWWSCYSKKNIVEHIDGPENGHQEYFDYEDKEKTWTLTCCTCVNIYLYIALLRSKEYVAVLGILRANFFPLNGFNVRRLSFHFNNPM